MQLLSDESVSLQAFNLSFVSFCLLVFIVQKGNGCALGKKDSLHVKPKYTSDRDLYSIAFS